MISAHPILDVNISIDDIKDVAIREGYILFLPLTFIKHLMCAFSYYKVNRSPKECIQEINDYTIEFSKVLDMINFSQIYNGNPITFAIRVLKLVSKKVDLRKLEKCATVGIKFDIEKEDKFQNYKFDLKKLSPIQLEAIGISGTELDTIILSDEVQSLLIFYDGLSIIDPTTDTQYDVIKKQITSFSDFYKGRRYKLALPTFSVDLGMKKLQITKIDDTEILASEVVIAIDCSLSMGMTNLARTLIRSVLLYYIDQLDRNERLVVTLLYIRGEITQVVRISNVNQLQVIFRTLPDFILPVKHAANIFKDIGMQYAGKSVIFLSDGLVDLKIPLKLNYKLYSIVLTPNEILKQTCLLSGGQFIVLK